MKNTNPSSNFKEQPELDNQGAKLPAGAGTKSINTSLDDLSAAAKIRITRDLATLEALIMGREAQQAREAAALEKLGPARHELGDIPGTTLGKNNERRIGGYPASADGDSSSNIPGFNDPLAGHRNRRPGSALVGPGKLPSQRDLAGQDLGNTDSDTRYGSGTSSSHGYVWAERRTERGSADGTQTWGS
ncbi:MAG: hypothetical protein AAB834_02135, partial [Patescibacteria group bacterium]